MTSRTTKVRVRTPDGAVREMTDRGSIDLDREVVHDRSGRRIDEAAAAAMAEEIEERPARGRPSLSGRHSDPGESKVVRARVPEALHTKFIARAVAEHKPKSELLRDALAAYLDVPLGQVKVTVTTRTKTPKKTPKKATGKASSASLRIGGGLKSARAAGGLKSAKAARAARPARRRSTGLGQVDVPATDQSSVEGPRQRS